MCVRGVRAAGMPEHCRQIVWGRGNVLQKNSPVNAHQRKSNCLLLSHPTDSYTKTVPKVPVVYGGRWGRGGRKVGKVVGGGRHGNGQYRQGARGGYKVVGSMGKER